MTGALIVFVVTYVVIASRQLSWLGLDRPSGALVGAVAMVAVGGLAFPAAMASIDLPVMTLLFGMMVIAYGVIYSTLLLAAGAAVAILALFGWALEPPTADDSEFEPPSDGGQPSKELAHV